MVSTKFQSIFTRKNMKPINAVLGSKSQSCRNMPWQKKAGGLAGTAKYDYTKTHNE